MLDLGIEYVSQPVREATQGQWDENWLKYTYKAWQS